MASQLKLVLLPLLAVTITAQAQRLTILHPFGNAKNGEFPSSALAAITPTLFYGTTANGGDLSGNFGDGCGVLFSLTTSGTYQKLYDFPDFGSCLPNGTLVQGLDGGLYGVESGNSNFTPDLFGSIFRSDSRGNVATVALFESGGLVPVDLTPAPDGHVYVTLNVLEGCGPGSLCNVGVDIYSYSTTDGLHDFGSINGLTQTPLAVVDNGSLVGAIQTTDGILLYKVDTSALALKTIATLPSNPFFYTFVGLAEGSDDRLYYVTDQNIFSTKLDGSDQRLVKTFNGKPQSYCETPTTNLILASDGALYGACQAHPALSAGVIYRIDNQGVYSPAYVLPPSDNGNILFFPTSIKLATQGLDGLLYGEVTTAGNPSAPNNPGFVYTLDLQLPLPVPSVIQFSPSSGAPGETVTIFGQHLLGATGVQIGGLNAPFKGIGDSYIQATVPAGAATGMPITITGPNGTGASNSSFGVK